MGGRMEEELTNNPARNETSKICGEHSFNTPYLVQTIHLLYYVTALYHEAFRGNARRPVSVPDRIGSLDANG